MNIGVFDSGLGGLMIAKALMRELPGYDYAYLGDTKRVPYGGRSAATVEEFTLEAVRYLLEEKDCGLVVVACNTASAEAVRAIQRGYLAERYPDRRVLGVLVPAAEAVAGLGIRKVGILATAGTVRSGAYVAELAKRAPGVEAMQKAAPLLVPLVEHGGLRYAEPILRDYLRPLLAAEVEAIVLGCTHYVALKEMVRKEVGDGIAVLSQDELIPASLKSYLERHPELEVRLSKAGKREYLVTDQVSSGLTNLLEPDELSALRVIEL